MLVVADSSPLIVLINISSSIRVPMPPAVAESHQQDLQVEPDRPVADVVEVALNAMAERGVAAPAVDLGPAFTW